ncbi:heme/copper-type cytochrome/quinol oxidase subunit 3 [Paraburkholderia sp. GAS32]
MKAHHAARTSCVAIAMLAISFLSGCTQGVLDPKGRVGVAEKSLIATSTWVMLIVAAGGAVLGWLAVTFVYGAAFLELELREFSRLIAEGAGPGRSAFLSSFFTLVGAHGLHVVLGLLWMVILAVQMFRRPMLTERDIRRLTCLSLFWHYLDIVWICVFTFVYFVSVI